MEAQKPQSTAKWDIPDQWASNGRCPACGAKPLKVMHLPDLPDYLTCPKCEVSFEVENGGRAIRVKYLPDRFESAEEALLRRWVDAGALHAIIESKCKEPTRSQVLVPQQEPSSVPKAPLTDEEVWSRTLTMYRMGNKPGVIEMILQQAGATHEQAAAACTRLKQQVEATARVQSQKVMMIAGVSMFLLVGAFVTWFFLSGTFTELTSGATPEAIVEEDSNTTIDFTNLIPDGVQPQLGLPDTTVSKSNVSEASCPRTAAGAAKTFGGSADLWEKTTQYPAWQLVSAVTTYTIQVPPGMVAGYVDNESLQLKSIHGPAVIRNVNFIVINCE